MYQNKVYFCRVKYFTNVKQKTIKANKYPENGRIHQIHQT